MRLIRKYSIPSLIISLVYLNSLSGLTSTSISFGVSEKEVQRIRETLWSIAVKPEALDSGEVKEALSIFQKHFKFQDILMRNFFHGVHGAISNLTLMFKFFETSAKTRPEIEQYIRAQALFARGLLNQPEDNNSAFDSLITNTVLILFCVVNLVLSALIYVGLKTYAWLGAKIPVYTDYIVGCDAIQRFKPREFQSYWNSAMRTLSGIRFPEPGMEVGIGQLLTKGATGLIDCLLTNKDDGLAKLKLLKEYLEHGTIPGNDIIQAVVGRDTEDYGVIKILQKILEDQTGFDGFIAFIRTSPDLRARNNLDRVIGLLQTSDVSKAQEVLNAILKACDALIKKERPDGERLASIENLKRIAKEFQPQNLDDTSFSDLKTQLTAAQKTIHKGEKHQYTDSDGAEQDASIGNVRYLVHLLKFKQVSIKNKIAKKRRDGSALDQNKYKIISLLLRCIRVAG